MIEVDDAEDLGEGSSFRDVGAFRCFGVPGLGLILRDAGSSSFVLGPAYSH